MGGRQTQGSLTLGPAIIALGPVGYWPLNEPSGTTAEDLSGNNRDGTYVEIEGDPPTLTHVVGPDGANYVRFGQFTTSGAGYVTIADNNAWSMNTASGLTIFACIKPDSVVDTTGDIIVSKGASGDYEWTFEANATVGGRLLLFTHNSAGSTIRSDVTNGGVLSTNWQAVACYSASPTSTSAIELRRNSNTELGDCTKAGFANTYTNEPSVLRIAWRGDNTANRFFQGALAHVAIFAGNTDLSTVFAAADADGWF